MTVTENRPGYERLRRELERLGQLHPQAQFHVHIDAAGQYAANLERFLRSLPLPLAISIGEPKRNKDYRKAFFPKRTSDDVESQAMARFGVVERPPPTPSISEAHLLLREIAGRLQGQIKDATRTVNRLHNLMARVFPELAAEAPDLGAAWVLELLAKYPTPRRIAAARLDSLRKIPYLRAERAEAIQRAARVSVHSLDGDLVERLVRQMAAELQQARHNVQALEQLLDEAYAALPPSGHVQLQTIPGIGRATAAVLAAKIVSIERFASPENLTGYFGVFPEEDSSGVDRQGNPLPPGTMRISRKGCDLVRRYLWNAAKSAIACNPPVRALYQRLRARGRRGDVALGHCMRKLLHQAFAVWTTDRPFDPQHVAHRPARAVEAAAASLAPPTETAAGHNREPSPDRRVVTAAASRLEPVSVPSPAGGIDYPLVRQQISFERVLSHLGVWDRLRGTQQRRGACPLCHASRSFSVDPRKNIFHCFTPDCHAGNVLDFWAAHQGLPLHAAASHLAQTFGLLTQRQPKPPLTPKHGVITPDAP